MKLHIPFQSPNTDFQIIPVHFLILHYSAGSLEKTLSLFKNPKKKISSHFIIDHDGKIYEILPCLNKKPLKAFHAGRSFWMDKEKKHWKEFNDISIGVELINNNGNIFPYTDDQYQSLINLTFELKKKYSDLQSPERVLGHEHIAGFRGKVDPGCHFHWPSYFKKAYPDKNAPKRLPVLPEYLKERFSRLVHSLSETNWNTLNTLLEKQYRHHLRTN